MFFFQFFEKILSRGHKFSQLELPVNNISYFDFIPEERKRE
jgi:hypothetical protein